MPYSSDSGKALIDRAVRRLAPHARFNDEKLMILDLGAGSGTYVKRYANLLPRSICNWTAVEIWEPYVEKFKLRELYDEVIVENVVDFLARSEGCYDFIFIGDLLEHLTEEDAIKVYSLAQQIGLVVIASLPIVHYPQGEFEGNPYEAHLKDDWSVDEALAKLPGVDWHGVENEIGIFISVALTSADGVLLADRLNPKIAVYGICKNELPFVERFYNSCKQADLIVMTDTGSTDGTLEKFNELLGQDAKFKPLLLSPITRYKNGSILQSLTIDPWRFDDARNSSLFSIPIDVDLCVSLDLDEELPVGWYDELSGRIIHDLRTRGKLHDRYNHRFQTIWNWQEVANGATPNVSEHWHERIHTRRGFQWKLPVHEILIKGDGSPEDIGWIDGPTMMFTQRPDVTKSRSSYLAPLEVSVREDPKRWKSWSFYASSLLEAGRFDDALAATTSARQLTDVDVTFMHGLRSRIYQAKGELNQAINEMLMSVNSAPGRREPLVYLAHLYRAAGQLEGAKLALKLAEGITQRTYGYEYDPSCWGDEFDKFHHQLNQLTTP